MSEPIGPGRSMITLAKLVRGTTYRLVLTVASDDGQATTDTATLVVSAR